MDWLNYNHLHYFWTVAKSGSLTRAAEELMLSASTVSAQVHALEQAMGSRLFKRQGRRLMLTDVGQVAYGYAESMFALGREMMDVVKERPTDRPLRLVVGVDEAVPKLVAREILKPALQLAQPVHLVCREGSADRLLTDLTSYRLDVLLADQPVRASGKTRVFNHPLGDCGLSFFAAPALAARLRQGFPKSLHRAPALLPADHSAMRRTLDRWFGSLGVEPSIVGEFDDSALTKVFGSDGFGFFAVPSVIAAEIAQRYSVVEIGAAPDCIERFCAISVERKLKHPAVVAITQAARSALFMAPGDIAPGQGE